VIFDDLNALLHTRRWVKRRVDRVEFLDLTTVRRTIALTIDLQQLGRVRTGDCGTSTGSGIVPLGWFVPWANAGACAQALKSRVKDPQSRFELIKLRRRMDRATQSLGQSAVSGSI
jgi:hypothetical protein